MQLSVARVHERGAVSIFLVIFFALLIGVITMSFIGIVIRDANQSTNNDLSRSAYDSAEAGIEDAKRAIAQYANACNSGDAAGCSTAAAYFSSTDCTAFTKFAQDHGMTIAPGTNDVPVQEGTGSIGNGFNQAYTCVNVSMNTPDYVNSESPYQSDVIPLNVVDSGGSRTQPSSVALNWFTHTDGAIADGTTFPAQPTCSVSPITGSDCRLPKEGAWGSSGMPALMRVELISYGNGPIDDTTLQNNAKTLFLYPTVSGTTSVSFDQDKTPPSAVNGAPLIPVKCGGTQEYACNITLNLGATAAANMFLRVTPVYKKTTFQISLAATPNLFFNGVQPLVDSTGRANDLFRRVQARVRMENQIMYPEYAVDSNNSFCKNFSVGSDPRDYLDSCP